MASPASEQQPAYQPSTTWREEIAPGESERFEAYARELQQLQEHNARDGKPARALHAKGMPGIEAVFTVHADLPAFARVGLFSRPGSYRTFVRFSNGSGAHQSDYKPDIRGIALK
ncbi:MAG: catalase, partial [Perlucidibaca sp.]